MYTSNQIHPKQKADVDGWSDEVFLNKAKITIDGKITNTAILLLGKPESLHYINHIGEIVWRLADKDNVGQVFTIPFLMTTTEVMHKIRNYPFKPFFANAVISFVAFSSLSISAIVLRSEKFTCISFTIWL